MDPDKKILLSQLHKAHEDLEQTFLEMQRWRKKCLLSRNLEPAILTAGSIKIGWVHDEAPHRHMNFTLQDVRQQNQVWDSVTLRLLEHHQHPGILIFRDAATEGLFLESWYPNGNEEGRNYLVLFPHEVEGRQFFKTACTGDFLKIRESVIMLAVSFSSYEKSHPDFAVSSWADVARLFVELIDDTEPVLHCGSVLASRLSESQTYSCSIKDIWCCGWSVPSLDLVWKTGLYSELILRLEPGQIPPLRSWPMDSSGSPLNEFHFPLGDFLGPDEKRLPWLNLSSKEKEFVLAVLRKLPDLFLGAAGDAGQGKDASVRLMDEASRMLSNAHLLALGLSTAAPQTARVSL